jgi:hypothetical protein
MVTSSSQPVHLVVRCVTLPLRASATRGLAAKHKREADLGLTAEDYDQRMRRLFNERLREEVSFVESILYARLSKDQGISF